MSSVWRKLKGSQGARREWQEEPEGPSRPGGREQETPWTRVEQGQWSMSLKDM